MNNVDILKRITTISSEVKELTISGSLHEPLVQDGRLHPVVNTMIEKFVDEVLEGFHERTKDSYLPKSVKLIEKERELNES